MEERIGINQENDPARWTAHSYTARIDPEVVKTFMGQVEEILEQLDRKITDLEAIQRLVCDGYQKIKKGEELTLEEKAAIGQMLTKDSI